MNSGTSKMEFSYIKIKELLQFAGSGFNLEGYHLAIPPWRAGSHVHNPYADPDDIALIYTRDEKGQICGYIGALPALLRNERSQKFAWISCWWVKSGAGSNIASELFRVFLESYDFKFMFSDMPPGIAKRIQKITPVTVKERSGLHVWLRLNIAKKLISKRKLSVHLKKLIKYSAMFMLLIVLDNLINMILFPWQYISAKIIEKGRLKIKKIRFPEEDDFRFIRNNAGKDVFVPELQDLEWYGNYPWLIQKNKTNNRIAGKYFFSSFAQRNELFWLKVTSGNQTAGMIMVSLRDGVANTQYVYISPVKEDEVKRKVLAFFLLSFKITDLISFNEKFVNILKTAWFPCVRIKKKSRSYGVSKELIAYTGEDFTMQDGSGDYIFA